MKTSSRRPVADLARDLAHLGIVTGDAAPVREQQVRSVVGAAATRDKLAPLTPVERRVFESLKPAAVAMVAPDGNQWSRQRNPDGSITDHGGNAGYWPARWALTASHRDNLTASWDRHPLVFCGVQFRIWSLTEVERDKLHDSLTGYLSHFSEVADGQALRHGFSDIGGSLRMDGLLDGAVDVAARIGVTAWVDMAWHLGPGYGSAKTDEFRQFLNRVHREAETMRRPGQLIQRVYEMAALKIIGR